MSADVWVVDASIALKWAFTEDGSAEANRLLLQTLIAPDLIVAECANAVWKKVRRSEISQADAEIAVRLLSIAPVEHRPTRHLFEATTRMAIEIQHPAYDCLYLALAEAEQCRFVTADAALVRKLRHASPDRLGKRIVTLSEAVATMASG